MGDLHPEMDTEYGNNPHIPDSVVLVTLYK